MLWYYLLFIATINWPKLHGFYIPIDKNHLDTVEEQQNAVCHVVTKEIQATANATITRQLKGVCTSTELNSLLGEFKTKMLQELDEIKLILEANGFKMLNSDSSSNLINDLEAPIGRIDEMNRQNDTVQHSEDGDLFFYYWKITGVKTLLLKNDVYISSPNFTVLGHNLQMQFYPNHLGSDFFGMQLRPDSTTFLKTYKLIILDQFDFKYDISSPVLGEIHSPMLMYRVSPKDIEFDNYIVDDSLIIKLELYLNS